MQRTIWKFHIRNHVCECVLDKNATVWFKKKRINNCVEKKIHTFTLFINKLLMVRHALQQRLINRFSPCCAVGHLPTQLSISILQHNKLRVGTGRIADWLRDKSRGMCASREPIPLVRSRNSCDPHKAGVPLCYTRLSEWHRYFLLASLDTLTLLSIQ